MYINKFNKVSFKTKNFNKNINVLSSLNNNILFVETLEKNDETLIKDEILIKVQKFIYYDELYTEETQFNKNLINNINTQFKKLNKYLNYIIIILQF
jgi:hypothetical protein